MSKHIVARRGASSAIVYTLLLVELIDELVFGARNAAWPMMRADLRLTYEQIGMLLALPTIVGNLIEPAIGLLGDTWRRRRLLIGGGLVFAASVAATAAVGSWIGLLIAFAAFNPASGAFVGLSQATLMDLSAERHEQNMARWVVAGSIGVVGGSALIGALVKAGGSWRIAFMVLGGGALLTVGAVAFIGAARIIRSEGDNVSAGRALLERGGDAIRALRRSDVRKWLILLECSDLMLDVLSGLLALYLVDVAHTSEAQAVLGVALFTGVGLAGDALLVPLLERVDGLRYLRMSVLLTLVAFPLFLLVPGVFVKFALIAALGLLNSGWYSIPVARLYAAMPNQSATVMTLKNTFGMAGAIVPLLLGVLAQRVGLGPTMWLLLLGPVALLIGLRERGRSVAVT